jgi:SulP family sulfate permease
MSFGEMALLSGGRRSASARADTSVECWALDGAAYARIERERPSLALRLLRNMLLGTIQTAVQLTGEVAALEG